MEPFTNSLQHILAELERIDLLIRAQAQRARQTHAVDADFLGLYISEQEVDALLVGSAGMPRWAAAPLPSEISSTLERLEQDIGGRKAASNVELRLDGLARCFGLTPFDVDVLLVALAPEIDVRYERLFGYLHDDVTRRRPSVDLALNLLCARFEDKLAARARFAPGAPLLRCRLIELFDDPSRPQPSLLGRQIRIDPRVVSHLFGVDDLDVRLSSWARCRDPRTRMADLVQSSGLQESLRTLAASHPVLYLQGPSGVGKETTAEALCSELGLKLMTVDLDRLLGDPAFETVVDLAGREAVLQRAALLWKGFDRLLADDHAARLGSLLARLEERRGLVFLTGETAWEPAGALHGMDFHRIEIPAPEQRERVEIWRRVLPVTDVDLDALAGRFRFTGGQIRDAAATARRLALRRSSERGRIEEADLHAACRLQSSRKLSTLAQKITPRRGWNDIVLPPGRLDQLREVAGAIRSRSRVYEDWGFGRRLSLGKGVNALFAGPPGTGKTLAAEILARELGLDLYKIDLSNVLSKYIGETEKNLARLFDEGRASNAILFFDEADAIFGKRTEVRDSHDRYANVEVSFLLQRMEEYEGVVILATNLRKNMDEAFVRRLHFLIDFPFPGEEDRRHIWEGLWPAELPRSADLDLNFMARRFEIAGGNIRNIAVSAAFLAAADGGVVTMGHLIRATQREYQKMGKVVREGELAYS